MASFNPVDGFLARGAIHGIYGAPLAQGRYSFQISKDALVSDSGKRHVLISSTHLLLLDPQSSELIGLKIDQIAAVKIVNAQLLHPALLISTTEGEQLELIDTVSRTRGDEITASLRGVVEGAEPLANLNRCSALIARSRTEAERSSKRADAALRGELLIDDIRHALREEVLAQGPCVYLGSMTPPRRFIGPAIRAVAVAGATTFGFINPKRSTRLFFQSVSYENIAGIGFHSEEDEEGNETWLMEFIVDSIMQVFLNQDDDHQLHLLVRLPRPQSTGPLNITDVIVANARAQSRFDIEGHIGPESSVPGLLLLSNT